MRNKEARSKEAGWDEDYPKVRVRCLVVITPAVKYRRFYLPKFQSVALPSVDVAPLRRLLLPCRWKFILRKICRYLTAGLPTPDNILFGKVCLICLSFKIKVMARNPIKTNTLSISDIKKAHCNDSLPFIAMHPYVCGIPCILFLFISFILLFSQPFSHIGLLSMKA